MNESIQCDLIVVVGLIFVIGGVVLLLAKAVMRSYFKTKMKFWKEWGKTINEEEKHNEQKVG